MQKWTNILFSETLLPTFGTLKENKHSCLELQNIWLLYLDNFRFEIVQIEMQENKRLKIETKWI
jgi:hypothetical protein